MKRLLFVLAGLSFIINISAQNRGGRSGFHEKMKKEKIVFFTEKLELSIEESKVFWPIYDEFENKRNQIARKSREEMRKLYSKSNEEILDKEIEKLADNFVNSKIKDANLIKTYHGKFKNVLPIRKVLLLYWVEDQYKSHLLNQIRSGGNSQGRNRGDRYKN